VKDLGIDLPRLELAAAAANSPAQAVDCIPMSASDYLVSAVHRV